MWIFLIVVLFAIFIIIVALERWIEASDIDDDEKEDRDRNRILEYAECEGSHHGPSTLGGVLHYTCLKTTGKGELTMWCHTHKQNWSQCIEKFGVS